MYTTTSFAERTVPLAVWISKWCFWSFVWSSLPVGKENSLPIDYVHRVLRLYDRFWLGCLPFLVEVPRLASCLIFLVLCPVFAQSLQIGRMWISFVPFTLLYDVTTEMHFLEVGRPSGCLMARKVSHSADFYPFGEPAKFHPACLARLCWDFGVTRGTRRLVSSAEEGEKAIHT